MSDPAPATRRPVPALCLVYLAFGMPIAMLGVAWPTLRDELGRADGDLGLLVLAYGLGRLATSASSGSLLARVRYGRVAAVTLVGIALADVWVATSPSWAWLVVAVTVVGLLSGVLDSLGARYLAVAGSVREAGLAAGSYGVGATIGPVVLALTDSVLVGFATAAGVALIASAMVADPRLAWPGELTLRRDPAPPTPPVPAVVPTGTAAEVRGDVVAGVPEPPAERLPARVLLTDPAVLVSLGLFAAFVGIEVTAGGWLAAVLEDARGFDDRLAGLAVGGFWGGVTVGRLLLGRIDLPDRALLVSVVVLLVCFSALTVAPPALAVPLVVVAGLAQAPQFPTLMARTGDRVGASAAGRVSGWQLIAANVGGTGLGALTGLIVDATGPAAPLAVLVLITAFGGLLLAAAGRQRAVVAARAASGQTT